MSDSIADLLAGRARQQPEEITVIKAFIDDRFGQPCDVQLKDTQIIITVKGAALAGALRPLLPALQDELPAPRRLLIRIK